MKYICCKIIFKDNIKPCKTKDKYELHNKFPNNFLLNILQTLVCASKSIWQKTQVK